jgi:uncharacterized membrane protein
LQPKAPSLRAQVAATTAKTNMSTTAKVISRKALAKRDQRPSGAAAKWPLLAAVLLAVFYVGSSLYIASQRLFWFDELFTIYIARLPHLSTIWAALGNGVDALPPTYYMLVRACDSLFGPSEVAARVPCAVAMTLGLVVMFDCARRLTNGLYALIAPLVAACSFVPYYGYEARSYGLYFLLSALALWTWSYDGFSRRTQAVLFGAIFFAGVCVHYYFPMCLLPYFAWELVRWKPGTRPSAKLIGGIVGSILPLVLLSPLILSFSRKFGGGYWNRPSLNELRIIYAQLFPDGLLLLALIMLWIALVRTDSSDAQESLVPAMPEVETIGWLFLAVPIAAYAVAVMKTNAFYSRYYIGVVPAVGVALASLLWRHWRRFTQVGAGIVLLLGAWGVGQQVLTMQHPSKIEATGIRSFLQIESLPEVEGKRYFVTSEPLFFLEAQHYSQHPEQVVLLLASDFSQHPKPGPDPYLHQRLEANLSQYHPLQIWTIDDLLRHREQAALIAPDEQALRDVRQAGMQPRLRVNTPLNIYYLQ